jgi:hypothetical protein
MEDQESTSLTNIADTIERAAIVAHEQGSARTLGRIAVGERIDAAWARFQAVTAASNGILVGTRHASDRSTIKLACRLDPPRQLNIQPANIGGHIVWEVRTNFGSIDVYHHDTESAIGVMRAIDLTPEVIDVLILALLDQEAWGEGLLPDIDIPGSMEP